MEKNINRVILVPCFYKPMLGGVELFTESLCGEFKKKNIEAAIITTKHDSMLAEEEVIGTVVVKRILPRFFWDDKGRKRNNFLVVFKLIKHISSLFKINKFIYRFRPEVINICYPTPLSFYFFILAYFYKIPIVLSLHGETILNIPYACRIEKLLFKFMLKKANYVTACSQYLLEEALRIVPQVRSKAGYIYNGITLNSNLLEEENPAQQIKGNEYMLTIANLWWYKGIDLLLMAFKKFCDDGFNLDLIIIGEGGLREELINLSKLLRIENRIIFKGQVDNKKEKERILKNSIFFVLPSRIEPFGIVNLEAMAAGKAILATRSAGIPEIVKDGINGILVEPYSDNALFEGMIKLAKDKDLRGRLGSAGRKMILEPQFSWEHVASQYLKAYQEAFVK